MLRLNPGSSFSISYENPTLTPSSKKKQPPMTTLEYKECLHFLHIDLWNLEDVKTKDEVTKKIFVKFVLQKIKSINRIKKQIDEIHISNESEIFRLVSILFNEIKNLFNELENTHKIKKPYFFEKIATTIRK